MLRFNIWLRKMRLILIRHGKTKGNKERRYIGRTDEPLSENTVIEKIYPNAEKIISSPMKRCIMTAELIYPNKKIIKCEKLSETDFGEFENKTYDELKYDQRYIEWINSGGMIACPGGESRAEFSKRCVEAYEEIIKMDSESIAVIAHGGTIMAIMEHVFGGDFYDYHVDNLEGYILTDKSEYVKI